MQAAATPSDLVPDSAARRRTMVDCQIRTFDVVDQRVIARFLDVPRERHVPSAYRALAYSDVGIVTPAGRYLLPPLILARMIQGAGVRSHDHVLDVGGGMGYGAAVLATLAGRVTALETPEVVAELRSGIAAAGVAGVLAVDGALEAGLDGDAAFDVILVNGAVETDLDVLFAQLGEGGRLVAVRRLPQDRSGRAAKVLCYEKRRGAIGSRYLFDASAPPLPGFAATPAFQF